MSTFYYHFLFQGGAVVTTHEETQDWKALFFNRIESEEIEPYELDDMLHEGLLVKIQDASFKTGVPAIYSDEDTPSGYEVQQRLNKVGAALSGQLDILTKLFNHVHIISCLEDDMRHLEYNLQAAKSLRDCARKLKSGESENLNAEILAAQEMLSAYKAKKQQALRLQLSSLHLIRPSATLAGQLRRMQA